MGIFGTAPVEPAPGVNWIASMLDAASASA